MDHEPEQSETPFSVPKMLAVMAWVLVLIMCVAIAVPLVFVGSVMHAAGANRSQADVVADLQAVGAAKIVEEAKQLERSHPDGTQLGTEELPPGLASLRPVYVSIRTGTVSIKTAGLGDWEGLVIPTDASPGPERSEEVAPGIFWVSPSQDPR